MHKGFTLIEVIVVIGMFSLLAATGLAFSFDSYRGYLFQSEYTATVNLLAKARNRAINNFNESCHGIAILQEEYRLFRSDTCTGSDVDDFQSFPRNTELSFAGPDEIIFDQLSGNLRFCSDDPCTITLGYGLRTKKVTVNDAGGIMW